MSVRLSRSSPCDGIRPREGNCGYVAIAIAVVALLHLLFLIVVRPYSSKLELSCSLLSAVVLVAIALLAVVATFGTASSSVKHWLGYLLLAESVVVFIQVVVLALHGYTVGQRKKLLEHQARVDSAFIDTTDESNDVALLAVPAATVSSSTPTSTSNPLSNC